MPRTRHASSDTAHSHLFAGRALGAFLALGVILFGAGDAAAQDLLWRHVIGGPGFEHARGLAVDPLGNIFLTGEFADSVDCGDGPLVSAGGEDIFLAKFDADGVCVWSRRFGGVLHEYGQNVCTDELGNVYITGSGPDGVDLGGGPLTDGHIFVAKFDPDGNHVWSQGFTTNVAIAVALSCDAIAADAGGVYITGIFDDQLDLGGGPLTSVSNRDIYLAKFDANGVHMWSKRFGDMDYQSGPVFNHVNDLTLDGLGSLFLTGDFQYRIRFGPFNMYSAGEEDAFVARFDTSGTFGMQRRYGGLYKDYGTAIGADGTGDLYVTGYAASDWSKLTKLDAGGIVLWDGAGGQSDLSPNAANGVFGMTLAGTMLGPGGSVCCQYIALYKHDADGNQEWMKVIQHPLEFPLGVALGDAHVVADGSGNVVVSANFQGEVDLGDGGIVSVDSTLDIFIAKYGDTPTPVTTEPVATALLQSYPNPFNPATTIRFTLESRQHVTLSICDVAGRRVTTLVDGVRAAGVHSLQWNGKGDDGAAAASGVYFCRLEAGRTVLSRRMVLLK